jgi:hypothetical protein
MNGTPLRVGKQNTLRQSSPMAIVLAIVLYLPIAGVWAALVTNQPGLYYAGLGGTHRLESVEPTRGDFFQCHEPPLWVADHGAGAATIYNGSGTAPSLVVRPPEAKFSHFDAYGSSFQHGKVLSLGGLWPSHSASEVNGGKTNELFFSAGLNHGADGLFGKLKQSIALREARP